MIAPLLGQQRIAFSGRVTRGGSFIKPIGNGLVLAVRSENGDFTIRVEKAEKQSSSSQENFASCVTPPYHGPNALEIAAWELGKEKTEAELAENKARKFQFVMNEADQKKACDEMEREVYGPAKRSGDGTIVLGDENYRTPMMGKGVLRIVKYQLQDGGAKDPEIESLSFRAEIELPGRARKSGR